MSDEQRCSLAEAWQKVLEEESRQGRVPASRIRQFRSRHVGHWRWRQDETGRWVDVTEEDA